MAEGKSAAPASNLRGLENDYDIRGELRGTAAARYYIGRRKQEGAEEVAITVFRAPTDGGNNALSHFASDIQILKDNRHPAIPRVFDGKWIGNDTFAVITERITGTSLDELLDRGEQFSNARTAMLLQDVSGVLDWARENGVVNRLVTPESLYLERDTNRVRVTLMPAPVPMTGVADACGDARTIGRLAWAMLSGHAHDDAETRSIGEALPNLAARVVDATDKMIRCKIGSEAPDIGRYLGVIAAGDALKQAEVELAAQKEEYQEAHEREIRKCELQRQQVEQHAAEQASILAGEREDFTRQMADERAAMEAEREQMRSALAERQRHLAQVRAELDEQRAELERRLSELEQYRVQVESVRDDALKAREAARSAMRDATRDATRERDQSIERESEKPIPVVAELPPAPKIAKPPKPPKWSKLEPVELVETDIVTPEAPGGRPRWMVPSAVAALVLILVAVLYGATHRTQSPNAAVKLGKSTVVPTTTAPASGFVPRGGFLTQSAGGSVSPQFGAPATVASVATSVVPDVDSAAVARARQDSIDAVEAARARRAARERAERQAARETERKPTQAEVDSLNTPASLWNRTPKPVTPPVMPSTPRADSVRVDTVYRRDTSFFHLTRPDTTIRPRPDTMIYRP